MLRTLRLPAAAALLAALPTFAHAHGGGDHVHGLAAGIAHPLFGADHLAAMVAVGLIAARLGGRALVGLPATFVAAMVAGALAGMAGLALPMVEPMIALSVVALGLVLAVSGRTALVPAVVALAGVVHGAAHGTEAPETASGLAYVAGFVAATAALHGAGVLAGRTLVTGDRAAKAVGLLLTGVGAAFAVGAV